jgi:hypothetical protein
LPHNQRAVAHILTKIVYVSIHVVERLAIRMCAEGMPIMLKSSAL